MKLTATNPGGHGGKSNDGGITEISRRRRKRTSKEESLNTEGKVEMTKECEQLIQEKRVQVEE